jgi:hypothetical protein
MMKKIQLHEFRPYFVGYNGILPYRWVRKLLAKTKWHRDWLAGFMGSFFEEGKHCGICDREWYQYRSKSKPRFY